MNSKPSSIRRALAQVGLCAFLLVAVILAGCATDTGNPAKDRIGRVTNVILKDVGKAVSQAAFDELSAQVSSRVSGNDLAHSAAQGLWTEALWKAGANFISAGTVSDIVKAYSGRSLPMTAAAAADAFRSAAPVSTEDQKAVIEAIAAAISEAAESEAAP